jgi:hypothetical protein
MVADLIDDLDASELDIVDGEFYWRCCRRDLIERVEALCQGKELPPTLRSARSEEADREEPTDPFEFLRVGLRRGAEFLSIKEEISRLYPGVVWRRMIEGERVPMRGAEAFELIVGNGNSEIELNSENRALVLRVYSGSWTGREVEEEIRRMRGLRPQATWEKHDVTDASAVRFSLSYRFVDEAGAKADACSDEIVQFPYVEVLVPFPPAPVETVGREYDAIVRNERRWHEALPGGGSRQDKEVAIRTWAVGLLLSEGFRFVEAMRLACEAGNLPEVTQARFGQDRTRLTERVPEAAAHLFAREPRSDVIANVRSDPSSLQSPQEESIIYT